MGGLFEPQGKLRPLRPRQASAIEQIVQAAKEGHKRIVVQAPTGFGKTLTAAHLIDSAVRKNKRPLFTCPAITLVEQTLKSFQAEGIEDIGVIQAQHEQTDWKRQVQIASVQTLIRRPLPQADFIIIDEVHLQWDALNERLDSEQWKNKIVIGLSATPWVKGLGLRWTKLIIAGTTKELIDEGFLCPFVVYAPADELEADLSKVKTVRGEFEEAGLSEVMTEKRLVADVVKTWQEKGPGEKTFLFGVNRAHAQALRQEFELAGIPCGYIDAFTPMEARKMEFSRLNRGATKVIASVGCLIAGVDEDVRCIIDAQPTKSEILFVQKIGRGLRTAEGKQILTVLDHAGNTLRLGLVTDIHHTELDKRKPQEKGEAFEKDPEPKKPRKCGKCHSLIPNGYSKCPLCGEQVVVTSNVIHEDGVLVLLGSKPAKKPRLERSEEQAWYSGLIDFGQRRGFKPGWAKNMFRKKFGVWPNNLEAVPMTPRKAVKEWIEEEGRKYRESKKAAPQAAQEGYSGEF